MEYAFDRGFAIVTTNARDFIELLNGDVHPGLIVLRGSGLNRDEPWDRIDPVVAYIKNSGDEDLLNKLIEITGIGQFEVRDIPYCNLPRRDPFSTLNGTVRSTMFMATCSGSSQDLRGGRTADFFVCILHAVIGDVSRFILFIRSKSQ